jgi:hypothetical protein
MASAPAAWRHGAGVSTPLRPRSLPSTPTRGPPRPGMAGWRSSYWCVAVSRRERLELATCLARRGGAAISLAGWLAACLTASFSSLPDVAGARRARCPWATANMSSPLCPTTTSLRWPRSRARRSGPWSSMRPRRHPPRRPRSAHHRRHLAALYSTLQRQVLDDGFRPRRSQLITTDKLPPRSEHS